MCRCLNPQRHWRMLCASQAGAGRWGGAGYGIRRMPATKKEQAHSMCRRRESPAQLADALRSSGRGQPLGRRGLRHPEDACY